MNNFRKFEKSFSAPGVKIWIVGRSNSNILWLEFPSLVKLHLFEFAVQIYNDFRRIFTTVEKITIRWIALSCITPDSHACNSQG